MTDVRAFTMGDQGYFVGIVALLNSLRITGNVMPLTVLDVGLAPWQRDLLDPHCDLVRARPGANIFFLKPEAPLTSGADVTIILDGDILVTGSLARMVDAAAAGKVCAHQDLSDQRWFAEWHGLLGLQAPLRREMYVNAGAFAVSKQRLPGFLPRLAELYERVSDRPMMWAPGIGHDDPMWLADQDVLNALLMSEIPAGGVERIPSPGMVLGVRDMSQVRLDDVSRLRCSRNGEPVTLLHATGRLKPWHARARREFRRTAYTRCLRRALTGPDLELRVPSRCLPAWLRPGAMSAGQAWALHAYELGSRVTWPLRRRIGLSSGQPQIPKDADPPIAKPLPSPDATEGSADGRR